MKYRDLDRLNITITKCIIKYYKKVDKKLYIKYNEDRGVVERPTNLAL